MCGRYTLTRRQAELVERFDVSELLAPDQEWQPRFNIAPSQMVPAIISQDGRRVLTMLKWGLIPFWFRAQDLSKTKPVINARSETMAEKPFFRHAVKNKRCLIPADGFYEWRAGGKVKTPMYIHEPGSELFAFAGLWDEWRSEDGEVIRTAAIITTGANRFMSSVHDRMPVIVRPQYEQLWLDQNVKELKDLAPVLEPLADNELSMHQVSPRVNSTKQDLPELVEPVPTQTTLFDHQS